MKLYSSLRDYETLAALSNGRGASAKVTRSLLARLTMDHSRMTAKLAECGITIEPGKPEEE